MVGFFLVLLVCCLGLQVVPSTLEIRRAMDLHSYMPFVVVYERDAEAMKKNEGLYRLVESKAKDYCRLFVMDCSANVQLEKEHVVEGCRVLQ